jgi:hypothetical protein
MDLWFMFTITRSYANDGQLLTNGAQGMYNDELICAAVDIF